MEEKFGICTLSVIPIRATASDKSELVSQLLFGEVYTILGHTDDHKWVHIETTFDSYKGWIDSKQSKGVSEEYFQMYSNYPMPLSKGLISLVRNNQTIFPVLMGSTLPFLNNGVMRFGEEEYIFEGEFLYPQKSTTKNIETTASLFRSSPYLWGGRTHFGIDCSGFSQIVFKMLGLAIPRDAWQQAEQGAIVDFLPEAQAGDLAFFDNEEGKITHVGIMLNNSQIIHASGRVKIDRIDNQGIFSTDLNKYSHKLRIVKRYV